MTPILDKKKLMKSSELYRWMAKCEEERQEDYVSEEAEGPLIVGSFLP